MYRKRGTNQYLNRYHYPFGLKQEAWLSVLYLIILALIVTLLGIYNQPEIISPLSDAHAWNEPTPTPTPIPDATYENVAKYIIDVFSPSGKQAVQEALRVAFCESGWRAEAYNYNTNKTHDFSVFQVNSIHTKRFGESYYHDWQTNIRTAYKIYLEQGWRPWVCAKKLGIVI